MARALLTKEIVKRLERNDVKRREIGPDGEWVDSGGMEPVVKLFLPEGSATWLLVSKDPGSDQVLGLCDLGFGFPELGYASLQELIELRSPRLGLPVERDKWFRPNGTMEDYCEAARKAQRIVDRVDRSDG